MSIPNVVRPVLRVLSEDQIDQVHEYSLQILSSTGVRIDSDRARRILVQAIGATGPSPSTSQDSVMAAGKDPVCLPRELVEWALKAAPSTIDVYDRAGNPAFRLPGSARFGIGVTALYYQDPESDLVSPFTRQHMEAMVRLGTALPSFDIISTIGIVQDVPPRSSDLYATLGMTANTRKPLVLLVSDDDAFDPVLNLLEHLHGDLAPSPPCDPLSQPYHAPGD